jgi:hypothetical protein
LVGGIHGSRGARFRPDQASHDFTKPVPTITHRHQFKLISRAGLAPAARNGFRGRLRRKRALEFVGNDEDLERHKQVQGTNIEIRMQRCHYFVGKPATAS